MIPIEATRKASRRNAATFNESASSAKFNLFTGITS